MTDSFLPKTYFTDYRKEYTEAEVRAIIEGAEKPLRDELRRLHEVNAIFIEALNDIACWRDGDVGGHMDEPGSAETARAALAKAQGENNG